MCISLNKSLDFQGGLHEHVDYLLTLKKITIRSVLMTVTTNAASAISHTQFSLNMH